MTLNVLFLGDIVGRPGRRAVALFLEQNKEDFDLIIANAENASGGLGLTPKNARQLKNLGIDVLTSGNHIWKYREIYDFLDTHTWLIRPLNYPNAPGQGYTIVNTPKSRALIISLQGRTYMEPIDCPFQCVDNLLKNLDFNGPILVDFHAEASSEKRAMGVFLTKRASAVLGTHTHIQTNDAQILDDFTGYIADAGMCGPKDSVLGMNKEIVLERFLFKRPVKFKLADGPLQINGVRVKIDLSSNRCVDISTVQRIFSK